MRKLDTKRIYRKVINEKTMNESAVGSIYEKRMHAESLFEPAKFPVGISYESFVRAIKCHFGAEERFGTYLGNKTILFVRSEDGTNLGTVAYRIEDTTLIIANSFIEEAYRGKGVYRALVARLLSLHPEIESIQGELVDDNHVAYISNFGSDHDKYGAVSNTPFYKTACTLGFANIDYRRTFLILQEGSFLVMKK